MAPNILITGGAGYIGGSLLAEFQARSSDKFNASTIVGTVRSEEQVRTLTAKGVKAVMVDLNDAEAVVEAIRTHDITIVIHCASGIEPHLAINLINGLGQHAKTTGEKAHFIHTSGGSAFTEFSGWPAGDVKDADNLHQSTKRVSQENPLRQTNIAVTEAAEKHGLASFIVVPPLVYGRGSGEWNKLSVCLPRYIKASILHKEVSKFATNITMPAVHVSDLMKFYTLLVEKISDGEDLPNGENGYYFPVAHQFGWWETLDRLASSMHARGLVKDAVVRTWPSDEVAAESLGLPVPFMHMIWNSITRMVPTRASLLGWHPLWDNNEKFLGGMDREVEDVVALDSDKSSVFDAFRSK